MRPRAPSSWATRIDETSEKNTLIRGFCDR